MERPIPNLPRGAVVFAVEVEVSVPGAALCALATDLPRYTQVEPRLQAARWLDDSPPRPGSRAEVVGDIPFSVPAVRRFIGRPQGIATLEEFAPPKRLSYSLRTPRANGILTAVFHDNASRGCSVDVHGWIVPRHAVGQLALVPLVGLLRQVANQAVRRGVLRAAAGAAEH